jgi:hypothetical protein
MVIDDINFVATKINNEPPSINHVSRCKKWMMIGLKIGIEIEIGTNFINGSLRDKTTTSYLCNLINGSPEERE